MLTCLRRCAPFKPAVLESRMAFANDTCQILFLHPCDYSEEQGVDHLQAHLFAVSRNDNEDDPTHAPELE